MHRTTDCRTRLQMLRGSLESEYFAPRRSQQQQDKLERKNATERIKGRVLVGLSGAVEVWVRGLLEKGSGAPVVAAYS